MRPGHGTEQALLDAAERLLVDVGAAGITTRRVAEEAKVNIYSAPGGLTAAQLETQVRSVLASRPVRAVSLTAYDPGVDADGRVPPIAMRLLEAVADHLAEAA